MAVVELFSPVYDTTTGGMTYKVEVLANWQGELEVGLQEARDRPGGPGAELRVRPPVHRQPRRRRRLPEQGHRLLPRRVRAPGA